MSKLAAVAYALGSFIDASAMLSLAIIIARWLVPNE
jgi:hypothetical protein